jgi:hypothetical protein
MRGNNLYMRFCRRWPQALGVPTVVSEDTAPLHSYRTRSNHQAWAELQSHSRGIARNRRRHLWA